MCLVLHFWIFCTAIIAPSRLRMCPYTTHGTGRTSPIPLRIGVLSKLSVQVWLVSLNAIQWHFQRAQCPKSRFRRGGRWCMMSCLWRRVFACDVCRSDSDRSGGRGRTTVRPRMEPWRSERSRPDWMAHTLKNRAPLRPKSSIFPIPFPFFSSLSLLLPHSVCGMVMMSYNPSMPWEMLSWKSSLRVREKTLKIQIRYFSIQTWTYS